MNSSMKKIATSFIGICLTAISFHAFSQNDTSTTNILLKDHPHDALYDTIAHMDSLLFDAFNHQNIEKLKTYFTKDLEFYHDKGGLTNYDENMKTFKENFDKNIGLKRILVEGSLQVYPCPGYGAMEIGAHTFTHKENGKDVKGTFQFAMVWKRENGEWKISRVLSYGH